MKTLNGWAFLFIALLCFIFLGCSKAGMNEGEKLPNLLLYDMEGEKVALFDHLGHDGLLLLHFWGAACCQTYSEPTLLAVSKIDKMKNRRDVSVVSVNLDYKADRVRRIIRDLGISQIMLNDRDSSFYNAEPKLKFFFPLCLILVVDENGIIKGRMMGPQLLPAIEDLISQAKMEGPVSQ